MLTNFAGPQRHRSLHAGAAADDQAGRRGPLEVVDVPDDIEVALWVHRTCQRIWRSCTTRIPCCVARLQARSPAVQGQGADKNELTARLPGALRRPPSPQSPLPPRPGDALRGALQVARGCGCQRRLDYHDRATAG